VKNEHIMVLKRTTRASDALGNGTLGKLDYLKGIGYFVEMLDDSKYNSERFKSF
jgi:hypothetical protein